MIDSFPAPPAPGFGRFAQSNQGLETTGAPAKTGAPQGALIG